VHSLEQHLRFLSAFNRQYRDVALNCSNYTMEELACFLWYGGCVAEIGPQGFNRLFKLLQPAAWHYLYNRRATEDQMVGAAASLRGYAEELEHLVRKQQACHRCRAQQL
jgi:hypothetical protein